ncbi:MAG: site-specific DNA-methyltransferase [Candidatus Moranbacteria bacterium]|nr:site-specific DNA-methyltransferase [Candidatus Moranbacteria bacterium]
MSENSLKKGRYTKYGNKIGLYSNSKGGFIKNDTDVVLNFPFKDAVLEAGMRKEDVGREERFLHIEIDSKDIDTLEEPKVLTDFRYVDKDGEKTLDASSDIEFFDTEGNLKQNLLIKGNNLLALYTLRERLAGQVKLIYIDPPYYFSESKSADTFLYNSNFKLSSWLTFMRNRLEVALELLSDDGIILVSISDEGQAYLKILMDEIFGHSNFVANIIWEKKKKPSFLAGIGVITEYVVAFAKNKLNAPIFVYGETTKGKKYPFNNAGNSINILEFPPNSVTFRISDQTIAPQDMSEGRIITELLDALVIDGGKNKDTFRLRGEWRYSQAKLDEIIANGEQIIISKVPFRPNHIKDGGEPKKMHNLLSIAHDFRV